MEPTERCRHRKHRPSQSYLPFRCCSVEEESLGKRVSMDLEPSAFLFAGRKLTKRKPKTTRDPTPLIRVLLIPALIGDCRSYRVRLLANGLGPYSELLFLLFPLLLLLLAWISRERHYNSQGCDTTVFFLRFLLNGKLTLTC
jgi:hypothetical protein